MQVTALATVHSRGGLSNTAEGLGLGPSKGPANGLPRKYAMHLASFMLLGLKLPEEGAAEAAPPKSR